MNGRNGSTPTTAAHRPAFDVPDADARAYYRTGAQIAGSLLRMLERSTDGSYRLLKTGIHALDRDVTIAPGTVTAILGRPSMGKSTLLKAIIRNELRTIAERRTGPDDRREFIAYVTLEEPEQKLAIHLGGTAPFTWRAVKRGNVAVTPENRASILRIGAALEDVKVIQHPGMVDGRIMAPLSSERVMRTIEQICEDYKQRPAVVALDYLQLLSGEGMRMSERSKAEHVMAASHGAVLLSRSLGCPVLMAVQATRETDTRGRKDEMPMPGLRDAQWASAIEQDCDNMIGVVRPIAVEGVREQVETNSYAELTIGGETYTVNALTGKTMFAVGVVKSRDDDAIGRRYVAHVDPGTLDVTDLDWRAS